MNKDPNPEPTKGKGLPKQVCITAEPILKKAGLVLDFLVKSANVNWQFRLGV